MNTTGRMGAARRCVDEYLSESIRVSTVWLPRLRDVPSARRLYAADASARLAAAIECGRRLAWEASHAYVATSMRQRFLDDVYGRFSWTGLVSTVSNWLTRTRQRLLSRKYGMSRMVHNHHGRYERLFRMLLYRPPISSGRELEELLAVPGEPVRLFPYRALYRAVAHYLRGADASPFASRLICRHAEALDLPPGAPRAQAESIRRMRGPGTDFDDYRCDVDPEDVPVNLRDLVPLARKWGIGDDGIRNDLRRLSTEVALRTLVEGVRGRTSEVDAWLHAGGDAGSWSGSRTAFLYLLTAYAEAGGTR